MTRLLSCLLCLTLLACAGSKDPADTGDAGGMSVDNGGAQDLGAVRDGAGSSGRTGLEGFCDHYKACGGGYYKDAEECVRATLNYWKSCRRPELDAFGDCMVAKVPCGSWNPDAYNPASTPCASEWAEVRAKMCN